MQLARIRDGIAEISQVPGVAFGQSDKGVRISGVAIQILYGPLISKTHRKQAAWGPALEYLMWRCLNSKGVAVAREAVHVVFASATPVDGQAMVAQMSGKIASRVISRRTAMRDIGIQNPDSELKRIVVEERVLGLSEPVAAIERDAVSSAKAGAKGLYAAEVPAGVGVNQRSTTLYPHASGARTEAAPASGTAGVAPDAVAPGPSRTDGSGRYASVSVDVGLLLDAMDAALDAEKRNIDANEQADASGE